MTKQSEDKNLPTTEAHGLAHGQDIRIRPEEIPRSAVPMSRKRPLTPDQVEAWIRSKELQPPK